ncbi:inner nuclear membrane protein enriched at telomere/subtelomere region [Coemansia guatemalensis]|uniref:Inner nuclear membrane protein enriched at telomere/subtelomere region n=1 Tax=Coemansia guatemalensis TaxID=2761395 RepID=A0A9W8LQG2_9FUNG|nr:inner nuclear membrane protein enriched at telomere/subtelomere region [Coemansia guatemalensis]
MSAIRNILVKHNVEYPSNAKKGELLDILQTSVLDRATKLRKEAKKQKRVKGDGRDIEQMAGASASNQPGVSTIGSRTRSQTPRTERMRPPMFPTIEKNEEKESAPAKEEQERVVLPKKKKKSTTDSSVAAEKKDKKKLKKPKDKSGDAAKPGKSASAEAKDDRKAKRQQSEPMTPPRATMGNAAEAKRTAGAKRKLSDAEQDTSMDSDDERFFTPAKAAVGDVQRQRIARRRAIKQQRKDDAEHDSDSDTQTPRRNKATVVAGHRGGQSQGPANFSDENPFQSSPETARKRRRRVEAAAEGGGPTTPMSALRKSQTSGVTFKVSLPRTSREEQPSAELRQESEPEASDSAMMEEDTPEPLTMSEPLEMPEQRQRVSDLVAKYQRQTPASASPPRSPTVRIRDGLKRQQQQRPAEASDAEPPKAAEKPAVKVEQKEAAAPRRTEEAPRGRFTMTPDALRQLAAGGAQGAAGHAPPPHEPRRRTMATGALPPIAPGIPAARSDKQPFHYVAQRTQPHERIAAAQPAAATDQAEAQELQRRRVATLRQHVEGARAEEARRTHSRRSSVASIASSVGEERGIPAIPAGAPAAAPRGRSAKGAAPWTVRVLWAAAAGAAALVWHAHAQFAVGFGSARSDYAPLAPPADSALAFPEPPVASDAPLAERVQYYAQYARAAFLAPAPLDCPAHADCVPYAPIPPAYATPAAVADAAARDKWLVPVVDRAAPAGTRNEQHVAVVQCDAGHVLQFPPLASWLLPRVPACVRDVSTELRVAQLVSAMADECGAARGRAQCEQTLLQQARDLLVRGGLGRLTQGAEGSAVESEDEAEEIERLGLSTADLRAAMWRRKSPRLTDAEFDELFRRAADELAEKEDLVANFVLAYEDEDESGETTYFVSRHPQYPPLCYARRLLLSAVLGNLTGVLAMVAVGVAAYVAARRYAAHRAEVVAADALVGSALHRLKRQARRHYLDPALSPSPAIPSLQLRDLLLLASSTPTLQSPLGSPLMTPVRDHAPAPAAAATYFDPRARNSVWERVRSVVERNANVRCRTTAVRGEPMRVWEWIGPLEDDDADVLFSPLGSPQ